MAATKSKKNSKLPKVDKISFCSSPGKNMAKKLYIGENGKFSRKVNFRHKNKTYPFQMQYRQRSRWRGDFARAKGTDYTTWSGWKAARTMNGIVKDWTQADHPVNYWMKSNKGVNKKSDYTSWQMFSSYQIPQGYDCRQFEFRIRSFNKSQAKHGDWSTQRLTVYKRAAVADEALYLNADGGLVVRFNYFWKRTLSIAINSIKDSSGRQLLRSKYETAFTKTTGTVIRENFDSGELVIPLSKLKRKLVKNEELTIDIRLKTGDGATTPIEATTVLAPDTDIDFDVSSTLLDDARGILKVQTQYNGSAQVSGADVSVTYTYNNKVYSVAAFDKTKNLQGTCEFYFYPPIGLPLTIEAIYVDTNGYCSKTSTMTCVSSGYRLNSINDAAVCGVAWAEPEFQVTTAPSLTTELPFGRESNIIFYGDGDTTQISLTARIIDKDNLYGGIYARKAMWDMVRENQGLYWFRSQKGDMYKVGITSVQFIKNKIDQYSIAVQMVEVV